MSHFLSDLDLKEIAKKTIETKQRKSFVSKRSRRYKTMSMKWEAQKLNKQNNEERKRSKLKNVKVMQKVRERETKNTLC